MITRSRAETLFRCIPDRRILVAGDIILDRYLYGDIQRISPEAPVPVIKINQEEHRLGGAANVAGNVESLGGKCTLIGMTGTDSYGKILCGLLRDNCFVIRRDYLTTVVKSRMVAQTQQVLRIDRESTFPPSEVDEKSIIGEIEKPKVDGILLSDYAKGFLTAGISEALSRKARRDNIPLVIDPKPRNAALYPKSSCLCPNSGEAARILGLPGIEDSTIEEAVRDLKRRTRCRQAVITRGKKGMTGIDHDNRIISIPAVSHGVYDVTGAGDTVAAALTLSLTCGANLEEAMELATLAASLAVEKFGATFISHREVLERIESL